MMPLLKYLQFAAARLISRQLYLLCILIFVPGFYLIASAEGTKQLEPKGAPGYSNCKITLLENIPENRIPFALVDCKPQYRLNIHISDYTTEKIYFGFGNIFSYVSDTIKFHDVSYQIKNPSGTVVKGLSPMPVPGSIGYIASRNQVDLGPDINNTNAGGYEPLEFTPAMNGDYSIEFEIPPYKYPDIRVVEFFDITVAKGNTMIPGRLWSKAWQLSSGGVKADISASYSSFYIYTADSIVTRFNCNGLAGGIWTIYSNEWGCSTSGTWSDRRRSIAGNASVEPEYKIFLNAPDSLVYLSGQIGEMLDFKQLPSDCDTVITFAANVSKSGSIEILMDVPPLNPTSPGPEDVQLGYSVKAGYNTLLPAWDGRNGQGIPLANGTQVNARIQFQNGLSNIPLYDVEDNPKGFKVDIQRPLPASGSTKLKLYWDDKRLPDSVSPSSNVTDGCIYSGSQPLSGCHPWTVKQGLGESNTINTWWYLTTDAILSIPITINLKPKSGSIFGPVDICDGQTAIFQTSTIPFAQEYIWHLSGPGVALDMVKDATDNTFSQEFLTSMAKGNYSVSVFGRNLQCGDGKKVFHDARIHYLPNAAFSYGNPCQGAGIIFTDQSNPADAPLAEYTWNKQSGSGDKLTTHGNTTLFVFDYAGNYKVSHSVMDAFGCTDTTSSLIKIKPKPDCSFEYTDNIDNIKGKVQFENTTSGASEYFWDFGNSKTSILAAPEITYTREDDYSILLVATNTEGCKDTAIRQYYYMPGLWLPNAFSPDNDGQNDIFRPVTQRTTLEPYQLSVFDRWGQLIFTSSNPDMGWDGKYKDEPCPAGNYSYLLQYREAKVESSEIVTKRGVVSLIR